MNYTTTIDSEGYKQIVIEAHAANANGSAVCGSIYGGVTSIAQRVWCKDCLKATR